MRRLIILLFAAFVAAAVGAPILGATAADRVPHQLIVNFTDQAANVDRAELRDKLDVVRAEGLGGDDAVVYEIAKDVSVPEALREVRSSGLAEFAEPNLLYRTTATPNDLLSGQWALSNTGQTVLGSAGTPGSDIGATRAWDVTTGSSSTIIAVIDTGIDFSHEDLSSRIYGNSGETGGGKETNGVDDDADGFIDNWHGWDFAEGDNDATDTYGHGTSMSGIAAAAGNNALGMTGVSWDARIMPLRVGTGNMLSVSAIVSAINYAGSRGATVVNMSFSGGYSSSIESAIGSYPDVFFAAAAGNNSSSTPEYPCALTLTNLVCDAATDNQDDLASFSNYGTPHVDIASPGVSIVQTSLGGSYQFGNGTSQATAVTTGAAALIRTAHPEYTAAEVRQRILDTVDPVASLNGMVATGGRLDVGNALDFVEPDTSITSQPPALTNDSTPAFSFSSNESDVDFECQIDAGGWTSCTSGDSLSALSDGPHTFGVRAVDGAHNSDATPATASFTVDTTAPTTSIDSGPSARSSSTTANFTYSAEPGATYQCKLDSGSYASCPSSGNSYFALSDGIHTFSVRATDGVGNVDQTPAAQTFEVDTVGPPVQIDSTPPIESENVTATFTYSSPEAGATFHCSLDQASFVDCPAGGVTYSNLAAGAHTFTVRAHDDIGNAGPAAPAYSFTVEAPVTPLPNEPGGSITPPNTMLIKKAPRRSTKTKFVFTFTGGSSYRYKIDRKRWRTTAKSRLVLRVRPGKHVFKVAAIDSAGADPTPVIWRFETS